ncbi:metallophosphoesterase [Thioalkalivibrio sp. XN8]|uniref:metallophosphoesterase n=1 Tax=Thioalkalivibrio sp. XN8 TaxID=2712863 RepID=UPI0013EC9535|nr:metallophosphoesterase [Thioalkalivibrio sp. XN8]NGP53426.1 hypothetical protein [Thioalkalivibrio sp. XN8]
MRPSLLKTAWPVLACWLLAALPAVATESWRIEGVERVVAVGDVHGAYEELQALLADVGLVDAEGRWAGGATHLVSMGDLLGRGDYGRQVMDLLMRLQQEAAAAGGAVHVLLGNHEVMSLVNDLRYVSQGDYAQFGAATRTGFPAGFFERRAAFRPDGAYGRWLLSLPFAIVINDTLFVHGGLSSRVEGLSLAAINTGAKEDLRTVTEGWHALLAAGVVADETTFHELRDRLPAEALEGLPFHPDGVAWYRGNARCHAWAEAPVLRGILEELGAARVVIGHTPTESRRATSRLGGMVYRVDAGMNRAAYQGRAVALDISDGTVLAHYPGEGSRVVEAEPARLWDRPYGMSDAEIEDFLRTAPVTRVEELGEGVTRPLRLTLERDGKVMQGVFKTVDTDPGLESTRRWSRAADRADRHIYDLVAYRLDRMLGLEMVPVAVTRELDGQAGTLQYWLPDSFHEGKRRERGMALQTGCSIAAQFNLMNVFDLLIFNVDRNLGNVLYDERHQVWLIDHSRAFGTERGVPAMLEDAQVQLTPELDAALARVTAEQLEPLRPYLHRRQLDALVSRAQALRGLR